MPIIFKFNPAFDSTNDLVSALELPKSISSASITGGFISVQEIDSSNDFISVCLEMTDSGNIGLNVYQIITNSDSSVTSNGPQIEITDMKACLGINSESSQSSTYVAL